MRNWAFAEVCGDFAPTRAPDPHSVRAPYASDPRCRQHDEADMKPPRNEGLHRVADKPPTSPAPHGSTEGASPPQRVSEDVERGQDRGHLVVPTVEQQNAVEDAECLAFRAGWSAGVLDEGEGGDDWYYAWRDAGRPDECTECRPDDALTPAATIGRMGLDTAFPDRGAEAPPPTSESVLLASISAAPTTHEDDDTRRKG